MACGDTTDGPSGAIRADDQEASGTALTADSVEANILQDVKLDRGSVSSNTEGALYSETGRKKFHGQESIFVIGDVKSNEWYFDSGVTSHMARANQPFIDAVTMDDDVGTVNNSNMKAVAKGTVAMETKHGRVEVSYVLKVPDQATNLLSVSTICKRGHKVVFTANKCEIWDESGEIVVTEVEEGGP